MSQQGFLIPTVTYACGTVSTEYTVTSHGDRVVPMIHTTRRAFFFALLGFCLIAFTGGLYDGDVRSLSIGYVQITPYVGRYLSR